MKASKELKKLVSKFDLLKDQIDDELRNIIDTREEVFNEKSERWQEGEHGELHREQTEAIEDLKSELETLFVDVWAELDKFDNV
mgnify:CR=1 FL=1|tara:strand:+ start:1620 stop:1871 length:252 start_codon:yes stop_codon:yes gene_type:complete